MLRTQISEAFILAAGLGTRMRPITNTIPKPLVQVAGSTMLDHALQALHKVGVSHAVVNVHYLADQIETHVASVTQPRITISDEREKLLDSGGGVKNGLHHFNSSPIFVLNADSFWVDKAQSNLQQMNDFWNPDEMDILLLLAQRTEAVGFDGAGDFFCDEDNRLRPRGENAIAPYVYAGAFIVKTELFNAESDKTFSLINLFTRAREQGRFFGHVLDGLWLHVGTPEAIAEAEQAIARIDQKQVGA